MKKLFSFFALILMINVLSAQNVFQNLMAYEAAEMTAIGTSYNDYISKTYKAPEGMKFVTVLADINEENKPETEVPKEELWFVVGDKKYLPVGKIKRGNFELRSPSDLSFKYTRDIAFTYLIADKSTNGVLTFGTLTPLTIDKFAAEAPKENKPKLVKVQSQEKLDTFEAKDQAEVTTDQELDCKIVYQPFSGKFLKLELDLSIPKKENASRGENYLFHPSHYCLSSKDGALYSCVAFIRDGDYDDPFSESMNHNKMYNSEEPTTITMVFYFGDLTGEFSLLHKGEKIGSISVK